MLARYATLTETEIKQLVIDDKWFATIQAAIIGEVQRLTQNLTERVKELEERYAQPLPSLTHEVQEFSMKVEKHLLNMGVDWREYEQFIALVVNGRKTKRLNWDLDSLFSKDESPSSM